MPQNQLIIPPCNPAAGTANGDRSFYRGWSAYWLKRPDALYGVVFLIPEVVPEQIKAAEVHRAVRVLLATDGVCPN